MWYDRVVTGPVPWYWIVAISVMVLSFVFGTVACVISHRKEWRKYFKDLLGDSSKKHKQKEEKIREETKAFAPSRVLVHRHSRADLMNLRSELARKMLIEKLERDRLVGQQNGHAPRIQGYDFESTGAEYKAPRSYPDSNLSTRPLVIVSSGRELSVLYSTYGENVREIDADVFNGNNDDDEQGVSEHQTEMATIQNNRLLAATENDNIAVDSASLITAYSQEFTVPPSYPLDQGTISQHGGNDHIGARDTDKQYGCYLNRGANLGEEADDLTLALHPVPGPSSVEAELATLSSRSSATSSRKGRESFDLIQAERFPEKRSKPEHVIVENDAMTGRMPPIDTTSSWLCDTENRRKSADSVASAVDTSALISHTSWASTVVKARPVTARADWFNETDSSAADDNEMELENFDFSSDTDLSESNAPEA